MIVGTYWCEEKKTWIRIKADEDQFRVEAAEGANWVNVENETSWKVTYKIDNSQIIEFPRVIKFDNNELYNSNLTTVNLKWNNNDWSSCRTRIFDFDSLETNITPKQNLPPLPEQIVEKQSVEDQWKAIQSVPSIQAQTENLPPEQEKIVTLFNQIMGSLNPQKFTKPDDYLAAIEKAGTDLNDINNNLIANLLLLNEKNPISANLQGEIIQYLNQERAKVLNLLKNDQAPKFVFNFFSEKLTAFWSPVRQGWIRFINDTEDSNYQFEESQDFDVWIQMNESVVELQHLGMKLEIIDNKVHRSDFDKRSNSFVKKEWLEDKGWSSTNNELELDKDTSETPVSSPQEPKSVVEQTNVPKDQKSGKIIPILNPYWCEKDKKWIRFVEINNGYQVQIEVNDTWVQRPNDEAPSQYTDKLNSNNCWPITYSFHENTLTDDKGAFVLWEGKLYHSTFIIDAYDRRPYSVVEKGKFKLGSMKNNPFGDMVFPKELSITNKETIPLTPEQVATKKKEWIAFRNSLIDINKPEPQPWETLMHNEFHNYLDISQFHTGEDYLTFIEEALTSENCDFTNTIRQRLAATTHIDTDCNLNPENSPEIRKNLYEEKQKYIYELLMIQRGVLLKFLGQEITPIENLVSIKLLDLSTIRPHDEQAELQWIQNTLNEEDRRENPEEYLFEILQQIALAERQEEDDLADILAQIARAEAAGLGEDPSMDDEELKKDEIKALAVKQEKMKLDSVKDSVTKAVIKYTQWYRGEGEFRGPNGFFSWLRHTESGQKNANNLLKETLQLDDYNKIVDNMQEFLINPKTAYHRHSLSSFLLDELKELKDSPWNGIQMSKSKHYNQDDLISLNVRNNNNNIPLAIEVRGF